uniref:Transmembrane protein 126A n=1 Tax=Homalodisca liturata TaxID=320908 RepID=A0A1B6INF0_9HEMI
MSNVYISKALRKDIPSDAILLTRDEALKMHWNTLKEWKPQTDTWPFRYGIAALAGLNAVTTINFVHYYRRKLNLGNYGRVTMLLPTAILPSIASTMSHYTFVTNSIFLGEDCPLCTQTRAAMVQIAAGVIYPIVVTPVAGFYYAISYATYNVPPLRREYLPEIFKLWLSMTRKLKMRLPIAIAVNGFAASILTYFEAKSFYSIQSTIYQKEEEFERLMNEGFAQH